MPYRKSTIHLLYVQYRYYFWSAILVTAFRPCYRLCWPLFYGHVERELRVRPKAKRLNDQATKQPNTQNLQWHHSLKKTTPAVLRCLCLRCFNDRYSRSTVNEGFRSYCMTHAVSEIRRCIRAYHHELPWPDLILLCWISTNNKKVLLVCHTVKLFEVRIQDGHFSPTRSDYSYRILCVCTGKHGSTHNKMPLSAWCHYSVHYL